MAESNAETEKEILERIGNDDDTGFDLMVEAYGPMLFRYTKRMCGDPSDAEDVLQDTFLTAQEKIEQFRGEGKLRNWLFTIAGNACRQSRRKRQGKLGSELKLEDIMYQPDQIKHDIIPWQRNPVESAMNSELGDLLEDAIAKIPETNRGVLLLRDIEGLSTRETANALDISEEAVKIRLHRARGFVRNLLQDYFEGK